MNRVCIPNFTKDIEKMKRKRSGEKSKPERKRGNDKLGD